MTEDKITIVDLRKTVAKQTGVSEAAVGTFLSNLLASITEGLKSDKSVKISGLGTFKLQWVEPRKSVNISTGEDIVIDGYNKLSFSAESSVKAKINEPFSALEAVELDDAGNPIESAPQPKPFSQIDKFDEQALEIKGLLDDLNGEAEEEPKEVASVTEEPAAEEPTVEEPVAEEAIAEEPTVDIPVTEEQVKEEEPAPAAEEPEVAAEEQAKEEEPAPATEEPEVAAEEPKVEEKTPVKENKKKPFRPWLVALLTILFFAIALVAAYFYLQYKVEAWADKLNGKVQQIEQVVQPAAEEPAEGEVLPEDSVSEEVAEETREVAEAIIAEEPKVAPTAQRLQAFMATENHEYTEWQGSVTVNQGSRLTWIAYKQYGRKDFWVFIYEANRDKIKTPSNVVVGTELRIPKLPEEIFTANQEEVAAYVQTLHNKYLGK